MGPLGFRGGGFDRRAGRLKCLARDRGHLRVERRWYD